jgi:transcriptional regulator with XRE-family HTH domain
MTGIGQVKHRMPKEIRQEIGAEICKAREARGLTQAELAKRVGYNNPKQIYRIEAGRSTPSVIMLARICQVLCVPMDEIARAAIDC